MKFLSGDLDLLSKQVINNKIQTVPMQGHPWGLHASQF